MTHTARQIGLWAAVFLLLPAAAARAEPAATTCVQAHSAAQSLRKDGQLLEARERLLRCARSDCPTAVSDDCAGWLPALENSIPTAVFAISDAQGHDIVEAKVQDQTGRVIAERSDGHAVALDPGVYTMQIRAAGFGAQTERVVVREAEKNRMVRVTLQPAIAAQAAPSPSRSGWLKPIPTASWILGGTALASGIVAGISGLNYLAAKSEIQSKICEAGDAKCGDERREIASRGKTYTTIDQIAGPIAGVSLLVAIIVYAASDPAPEKQNATVSTASTLSWRASGSTNSASLLVSGHF